MQKKRKCHLIIDSCCDLPADLVASYDVGLIRFTYTLSDGEHLDDLGVTQPHHEFYDLMRKGEEPTTTQVPVAELQVAFQKAIDSGIPTVYLCFPAALSGSFDTASLLAESLVNENPGAELYVVDTKLPSATAGLLIMEAVRQLDAGLTAKELVKWAEEARYYVNAFFTLDSLDSLRRGGRIPDMAAVAGAKLDIKPLLSYDLDGRLTFKGVARGRKKAIKQLLQCYYDREDESTLNTILVCSGDAPKEQNSIAEHLLKTSRKPINVWQTQIGAVIGSHVGPGMLAIVFWGPDRRKNMGLTDRIAQRVSGNSEDDDDK